MNYSKEFKAWNRKRLLGMLFLGLIIMFAIIGLGVVINFTGNVLFPDWWNNPLGT